MGSFFSSQTFFNISMAIYLICFLGYLIFTASRNKTTRDPFHLLTDHWIHYPLSGPCPPLVGNPSDGLWLCSLIQYV